MPVTVPTPPQVVVDKGTAKVSFPAKMVSGLHKLWALKALAAGGAASACACLWVRSSGAERPSRHFPPPEQGAGPGSPHKLHPVWELGTRFEAESGFPRPTPPQSSPTPIFRALL